MRLRTCLLFFLVLAALALPACGRDTPTPTRAPISIPDVQKPGATNTPALAAPTSTPVPPTEATLTPYPVPVETPEIEAYPVPMDGKALLEERCVACHTLERVTTAKKDVAGWEATVRRMIAQGAQLTDDEAKVLIEYLAETYK